MECDQNRHNQQVCVNFKSCHFFMCDILLWYINKERNGSSHSSPYFISQDSYSKMLFKYTVFWFNMADIIYSLNTAAIRCTFSKEFISREFKLRIHIFLDITMWCCKNVSICFYGTSGPTHPMTLQKNAVSISNLTQFLLNMALKKNFMWKNLYFTPEHSLKFGKSSLMQSWHTPYCLLMVINTKYININRVGHLPHYLSHLTAAEKYIPSLTPRKFLWTHVKFDLSLEKLI